MAKKSAKAARRDEPANDQPPESTEPAALDDTRAFPAEAQQRRAQGGLFDGGQVLADGSVTDPAGVTTYDEWKPAEPTPVMAADDIPTIGIWAARPAVEADYTAFVPGAGDPQNGIMLPEGRRWIAWVDNSHDIAQHYPQVEPHAGPPPAADDREAAQTETTGQ